MLLPPSRGQCRNHFSRPRFGNPLLAANEKAVLLAHTDGRGQVRNTVTHPLCGLAQAGGGLFGAQQEVGVGHARLLLDCQHAGMQGTLQGGGKGQQPHDVLCLVAGHLAQQFLELLAWGHRRRRVSVFRCVGSSIALSSFPKLAGESGACAPFPGSPSHRPQGDGAVEGPHRDMPGQPVGPDEQAVQRERRVPGVRSFPCLHCVSRRIYRQCQHTNPEMNRTTARLPNSGDAIVHFAM